MNQDEVDYVMLLTIRNQLVIICDGFDAIGLHCNADKLVEIIDSLDRVLIPNHVPLHIVKDEK